jgi:phosphoribosylaminoimidazole-succinocarboxamide synthase
MLQEVTNAISVFDFQLNFLVPGKGVGLTIMSHFVFGMLEKAGIKTHMVAAGAAIDEYLPAHLRGDPGLQSRAMIVRKLQMIRDSVTGLPIELIDRSYLAGSAKKEYARSGTIAGIVMPRGLQPGDTLPRMIFNPTTKAPEGHDEPIPRERVEAEHPVPSQTYLRASRIVAEYALSRGLIKADGKGEGGYVGREFYIGDEFGTFDCCRYWDHAEWLASRQRERRTEPTSYDKQVARDAAMLLGFDKLDPKNVEHIARVHVWEPEQSLITEIGARMTTLITRLCGKSPDAYLREDMGVVS